jgi:hypothetical protein
MQENFSVSLEKRREELDKFQSSIYTDLENKTKSIFDSIDKIRTETSEANKKLSERFSTFEKYIWMAVGGITVISWLVSLAFNASRLLHQ